MLPSFPGSLNTSSLLNVDVVWRAAVKLAYDGRDFMGSQRQPGERTMEDDTILGLKKIGAIRSVETSRFRTASRTDRGVSALGNVVAFNTDFREDPLLRALNAASPRVYYYAVASVPLTFSPRIAKARWYRYLLPDEGLDHGLVVACAKEFEGRHDYRRFCKVDGRSTIKRIDSIEISAMEEYIIIDIRGREFLRNMVRRMVAAIEEVGNHHVDIKEVEDALAGKDISFGLAPPENLTLMDIEYDVTFRSAIPIPSLGRCRNTGGTPSREPPSSGRCLRV